MSLDWVSVPLRGNGYRKYELGFKHIEVVGNVSVPLRGNGYRKSKVVTVQRHDCTEFPSPCGVMVIGNLYLSNVQG